MTRSATYHRYKVKAHKYDLLTEALAGTREGEIRTVTIEGSRIRFTKGANSSGTFEFIGQAAT